MTPRLVGIMFYANLLPGRVIDATPTRALPDPSDTKRTSKNSGNEDAVILKSRRAAEEWETGGYSQENRKQLYSVESDTYDGVSPLFSWFQGDPAAQYEFYARMLAAPYHSSLNVYA